MCWKCCSAVEAVLMRGHQWVDSGFEYQPACRGKATSDQPCPTTERIENGQSRAQERLRVQRDAALLGLSLDIAPLARFGLAYSPDLCRDQQIVKPAVPALQ